MGILDQYRENKRKRLYDRYQNEKDTGQKLKLLLAILELDGIKINDAKTPKSIANNKRSGIIKIEPFNKDNDLPDGQHWITSKDGHKLLLDKEGVVIAGAGGTLNGLKLSETKSKDTNSNSKTETSSNSSSKKSSKSGAVKTAAAKVKKFGGATTKAFATALSTAHDAMVKVHPDSAFRVTVHTQDELDEEYPGAKLHVSDGGSTVAVTASGDIISVCKHPNDATTHGKDLIAMAVENGGKKLDSYDGNHGFYLRCGFEPVSWCKWDDNAADEKWINQDWLKANGLDPKITTAELRKIPDSALKVPREDVVFYKYTGKSVALDKQSAKSDLRSFKEKVPAAADYDEAQRARDDSLEE